MSIWKLRLGELPPVRRLTASAGVFDCICAPGDDGSPTLLLFNGAGVTLDGWRALFPAIESLGTVFAWNRAGVGRSAWPAVPQTAAAAVATLRELLAAAQLPPPYLLVAHSLGGLHAQWFARHHPQDVAAVLLLEATHPGDRHRLQGQESRLAEVLGKLFALPQKVFRANLHSETDCLEATVRELAAAPAFPPVPLAVVIGGKPAPKWLMAGAAQAVRRAHQADLARLSPQGVQVVAEHSGHFPKLTEPAVVVAALRDLLARA